MKVDKKMSLDTFQNKLSTINNKSSKFYLKFFTTMFEHEDGLIGSPCVDAFIANEKLDMTDKKNNQFVFLLVASFMEFLEDYSKQDIILEFLKRDILFKFTDTEAKALIEAVGSDIPEGLFE